MNISVHLNHLSPKKPEGPFSVMAAKKTDLRFKNDVILGVDLVVKVARKMI